MRTHKPVFGLTALDDSVLSAWPIRGISGKKAKRIKCRFFAQKPAISFDKTIHHR